MRFSTYFSALIFFLTTLAGTASSFELFWDSSGLTLQQPATGLWSIDPASPPRWSGALGTFRQVWSNGGGLSAGFTGTVQDSAIITVELQPRVDSLRFYTNGFIVTSDTIKFDGAAEITGDSAVTAQIRSVLNGSSGLKKLGKGTLLLGGKNRIADTIGITSGIVKIADDSSLGVATTNRILIDSGAALDVNGINLQRYTNPFEIKGQLNDSTGAIFNTGASQLNALPSVSLSGSAAIGGNSGRFDIGRSSPNITNFPS